MIKTIPGYPMYMATDDGKIYSLSSKKFLKQTISKFGYARVTLYKGNGEKHKIMVHRLVAIAFLHNPDSLPQVNHINENRLDNRVKNLEWCSASYNINYGNRNYAVSKKMQLYKEKTTAKRIKQINLQTGKTIKVWKSMHAIERELNIPHSGIYSCCTGKRKTRGGYAWQYAT